MSKDRVAASISRAKIELDSALENLEMVHPFDPGVALTYVHALNNVLTVMCWTIDLVSLEAGDDSEMPIQKHLRDLSHAVDRAKELTSDLSKSSVYTGAQFDLSLVNINSIILSAVDYYAKVARKKGIELLLDDPLPNIDAWVDRIGVSVVFDNLLSNAVKYTSPGKSISVHLKAEEKSALCSVCDQGPGLTREDLEKLFQPGVRLSAVPTAGESSSGYGLAVTKRVIDILHGEIWCDSEHGHGACFRFRLPRNPPSY